MRYLRTLVYFLSWRCFISEGSQLPFLTFGGTDYVRTNFVPSYRDAISAVVTVNISGSALPYINGSFPDIIARAAEIYVSENGIISFGMPLHLPPRLAGPSLLQDAGEVFAIAPFWADNNLNMGIVRYEIYELGLADAEERLDRASQFVNSMEFKGNWMLLVEWSGCQLALPPGQVISFPSDVNNTYQAVVITDGKESSFAIFIYRCDYIKWSGLEPLFSKIGINFGGGLEVNHLLSGNEIADEIDCSNPDSEWVNVVYDLTTIPREILAPPSSPSELIFLSQTEMITSKPMPTEERNLLPDLTTLESGEASRTPVALTLVRSVVLSVSALLLALSIVVSAIIFVWKHGKKRMNRVAIADAKEMSGTMISNSVSAIHLHELKQPICFVSSQVSEKKINQPQSNETFV